MKLLWTAHPPLKRVGYCLSPAGLGAQNLLREKDGGINGLIFPARGYIFRCEIGQETFQFLFARQMRMKPFEVVAILPESGAITRLCGERKMLASKCFRKSPNRVVQIHLAILYTNRQLHINCWAA